MDRIAKKWRSTGYIVVPVEDEIKDEEVSILVKQELGGFLEGGRKVKKLAIVVSGISIAEDGGYSGNRNNSREYRINDLVAMKRP